MDMKKLVIALCAASVVALVSCAGPDRTGPQAADVQPAIFEVPPETAEVLARVDAANAYQVPDLGLRVDEKYANTTQDLEPFRHVEPHKRHFLVQMEYTGAGRTIPEPQDVNTVKIGFIGPITSTVSVATGGRSHGEALGVKMLQGSQLAIEQANTRGGYVKRGIPFELVVSNDNGLWGSSGNEIIKLAYKDQVWAILGTIDGANSHIAIRVGLKAEIPMMNTGDTDPTFIETNIPWVMRCIGDDRQQSYLLADYLYRKLDLKRVGIIRASNRYARFGVREINDSSRRLGRPIVLEMAYSLGIDDFSLQLERLREAHIEAIVHWGDAREGALILNQMRRMGMEHPYFACDRCISDEFVELAGANAEGVICTSAWDPTRTDPPYMAFRAAFRERFGEEAETFAAHAYDGMNLLIWAIQAAGLNRARMRDVLAHRTTPWKGVTGDIVFSAALDDVGDVYLARRQDGRWNYYSREELGIPRQDAPPRDRAAIPSVSVNSGQQDLR
jgi:ABC-type branched-subunit amino acid transport system substrate-binding protein